MRIIRGLVRSGRYYTASEVRPEGLRLVEQPEAEDAARLDALRRAAQTGIEATERGECRSFESFAELEGHLAEVGETAIVGEPRR